MMRVFVLIVPILATAAAAGAPATADAALVNRCGSIVDRGAFVDFIATSIVSDAHRDTKASSCRVARSVVRTFFARRGADEGGACATRFVTGKGCRFRVRGSGTWTCYDTGYRRQVSCGGPRTHLVTFNLRDRTHR